PPIPENGSDKPEVPGQSLSIPPEAADGQADFLNGRFRAGAGIQDKTTGKPLRLEYQFKDGQGQVVVRKPDGISCTGPVTAAMHGGNLSINSLGQAACGDGSRYEMPKVDCRQGAKSIADCSGIYEDKQFPISMRQMGE
ncbi:SrfA family protein, partial [Pseudomonas helleri]